MRGDGTSRAERVVRGTAAVLTLVDGDGNEYLVGASLTTARLKGAPLDSDVDGIQPTEATAEDWRIKEFRIITP